MYEVAKSQGEHTNFLFYSTCAIESIYSVRKNKKEGNNIIISKVRKCLTYKRKIKSKSTNLLESSKLTSSCINEPDINI